MAERERNLIDALGRIIRSPALAERIESRESADAVLDELGIGARDRAAMLGAGERRLLAYHTMAHARLRKVVRAFLPRTLAFVGREALDADVDAFIAERGSHSPFLRDVPGDFVRWVGTHWNATQPAFVLALARYELLAEDVPNDEREIGEPTDEPVALDRGVRVNVTARCLHFEWAVHTVPEPADGDATLDPPADDPVRLVVCRDRKHTYRERVVTPLDAALFERLAAGAPLQAAVIGAASDIGAALDDALLEQATYGIAGLAEIDALLGAEPAPS